MFRNLIAAACGAVLCALAPSPVFASLTNVIDVAKLAAAANEDAGEIFVDGWRLKGLGTYSSDCFFCFIYINGYCYINEYGCLYYLY